MKLLLQLTVLVLFSNTIFGQTNSTLATVSQQQQEMDRNGVITHPETIQTIFLGESQVFRDVIIDPSVVHPITKPKKYGYHAKDDWLLNETINPNALPQNGDEAHQKEYNRNPSTNKSTEVGNWEGMGTTTMPGDPALDVGPNHVVQMLNGGSGAVVKIWDKTGGVLLNTTLFSTLAGTGSGLGDPVVLYDERADRWLLSEFQNGGNNLYIAISTTPDPTGSYFIYSVLAPTFPDYPKYSIWDNSYLITANESGGSSSVYALDRTSMLAGGATSSQRFTVPHFGTIGFQMTTPVSILGTAVSGTPALLMRMRDDAWTGSASDALEMWELDINWATPGAATLTQVQTIGTTPHETELCGYTSFACIPQQGSGTTLDPLREILMNRIMYRNFGTHESIVCAHVTDVDGTDWAGIRWYELRRTGGGGGTWSIYQEGTYAPDGNHRWMPTIGLAASGNIGLAYNVASSSMHPEIRYTGRKECDPLGVMTEAEVQLVDGTSPNNTNRWGDYNSMGVDPTDGETFWFTAQYNPTTQASTRIGAFNIDNCSPIVQFGAASYTQSETDANVANGCLPYYVLNVPISIGSDPSQPADVTVTVTGGTATQGVDYVINNVSYTFDAPTLTGTAEIWIYNDDYVEGNETIDLGYTLNANGGNATNGTFNQTVTITINDDDLAPSAMITSAIILTQDFEAGISPFTAVNNAGGGGNLPWQVGNNAAAASAAYAIPVANATQFAWINDDNCNCNQNDVDLLFPVMNLSNYTSAALSMDSYFENNLWAGNQEVAEIRVSIAGGPFTFVANVIASPIDVSWTNQIVDLTPYVGNASVQLAINYSDGTGWLYGCAVDNINVIGTLPIDIQTAVNTGAGDQANLGPNETVHFYDPTSSDVMMTIVNTSAFDYGCITVEVDRDGSTPSALEFASAPVADYLHSKTYTVVPTNSNPTGTFDVTVYYKEAEVATWEATTGNSRNNAEIVKVLGSNAINDVTPANYTGFTIDNIPAILGTFNSDVTFTSSFTNGFSGFGVGIYNITTVTVTHTTVNTNLTCNGDNSGSIVVTASGGSTPYQYSIDGGTTWQASNTFSGLAAGTYSVLAQDAGANMSTASSEILTEPTVVTYSSSASNVSCNGNTDGTITLTASGGGGTYQYSIDGGTTFQSSGSFASLGAATYSIVVEDVNGCQATGSVTLTEPSAVTHTSSSVNLTCNGDASGSITLAGSGGSGSLQYSIDGGTTFQASGSFTGLSAGSYSVVVEDVNSCQSTETITITQPAVVSYTSSLTNLSCNGDGSGQIVLVGSGGTSPYQYSIDGGTTFQTSGSFTGLNAASYSVIIQDASSCQATGTETLTEPAGVSYTNTLVNPSCNGGNDGSISFSASGGVNPLTYSIDGGTTFQGGVLFSGLNSGSYNLVVEDGNGCQSTSTETLTDPIVISYTSASSPETCGSSDGSITITASGGTGALQYSIDGGTTFQASNSFTSLNAGLYNVVVEDANNCQATGSETVGSVGGANITNVTNTEPTCNGDSDANISITATGGTNPKQYSIDGGTTFQNPSNFNGLSAGTYNIVVQDGSGCQTTATVTITDPALITYMTSVSDESCSLSNGIITLTGSGGTGALQYSIDGGTTFQFSGVFNSLNAGNYNVVVEDANGCQVTSTETVGSIAGPVINTITETDITCNGASDGIIFIAASGGSGSLQYSIDGGTTFQASATFNGLAPGVYPITIEDAGGCQATSTATLTEPTVLTSSESVTDASCNGGTDGVGTINASGGTSPYQYSVDGGVTFVGVNTFGGLPAGSYPYIVEDANGCQANGTAVIGQPSALSLGFTSTSPLCAGDMNGSITMTPGGGVGFYQFSIDGGTTFQGSGSFTGLGTGTYNLVLEDGNGCQQTGTVSMAAPAAITYGSTVGSVSCNAGNDGTITLTGSGGTGTLNYSIDGGTTFQTSGVFNGVLAGSYSIVVEDANGCQGTGTVSVTEPVAMSFTSSFSDPNCNGGADGTITITASGGTGTYQYSSDGGVTFQASNILTGLSAGTISVVVEDVNGCQQNGSVVLSDPAGMTYSIVAVDENCGLSDGSLTFNVSGGANPIQYSIDGGTTFQASGAFSGLSAGSYSFVIEDLNGCQIAGTEIVNSASGIGISSTSFTEPTCNAGTDGSLSVIAIGGTAPLQYSIDGGTTFQSGASFSSLTASSYSVVVEDAVGCQVTTTVNITEPSAVSYSYVSSNENCGAVDGTITLSGIGGTTPFQYSIDGGTTFQSSGSFTGLLAGSYNVIVEDANGCQITGTETVLGSGGATINSVAGTDPLCFGGIDGEITISATGGTAPLQYSIDGGTTFQSSNFFNGLLAGNYTIVVEDAVGCQSSSSVTLVDPSSVSYSVSLTDENCGAMDGEISLTGAGGSSTYQYSIDGGTTFQASGVFTGLVAGTYTILIEDMNGCQVSGSETINGVGGATINAVNMVDASCFGLSDGSITIVATGGIAPLQYSIDGGVTFQTSSNFTGVANGTYSIVVEDANGCQEFTSGTVSSPAQLVLSVATNEATCGNNDGDAAVVASGGDGSYSYQWDDGLSQTTPIAINLSAGIYNVVVTDGNGCSETEIAFVSNVGEPDLVITSTDVSCYGDNDGTSTATVTGGVAPITYQWDDANTQTTTIATNLTAGTYIVQVTDAMGCIAVGTIDINQPDSLEVISSITNTTCGFENGIVVTTVSGGTLPFAYSWNDVMSQVSATAIELAAGDYIVSITDANNCSVSDSVTIANSDSLVVTVDVIHESCLESFDGSIETAVAGGISPYNYLWSNGDTTEIASLLTAGNYYLTVGDSDGCSVMLLVPIETLGENCISIPTAISPNGDGANDVWNITGLQDYPEAIVEIYNRWGSLIYNATDYQNDWDGTYNGNNVPAGVYYFIVKVSDDEVYTGSLTVLR